MHCTVLNLIKEIFVMLFFLYTLCCVRIHNAGQVCGPWRCCCTAEHHQSTATTNLLKGSKLSAPQRNYFHILERTFSPKTTLFSFKYTNIICSSSKSLKSLHLSTSTRFVILIEAPELLATDLRSTTTQYNCKEKQHSFDKFEVVR